jgi:hypothetical protein
MAVRLDGTTMRMAGRTIWKSRYSAHMCLKPPHSNWQVATYFLALNDVRNSMGGEPSKTIPFVGISSKAAEVGAIKDHTSSSLLNRVAKIDCDIRWVKS